MRAVFTFDLPRIKNEFIDNEKVVSLLQELGWAFQNITQMRPTDLEAIIQAQKSDREIREISRRAQELTSGQDPLPHEEDSLALSELCAPLFKEMPEVAAAERNATVFLGYIANDQTVFVVTRMIRGQVTFRLLHRQLPKLQSSTVRMMQKLLTSPIEGELMILSSGLVSVYERHFDHVIINGRVITSPLKETLRSNFKDAMLVLVPTILLLPIYASLNYVDPHETVIYGTLERLSTAFITAVIVSGLGLFTVWREIRRHRLIDWSVDNPSIQSTKRVS